MAMEFHPDMPNRPPSALSYSVGRQEGRQMQRMNKRFNQGFHPDDVRYITSHTAGEHQYYGNGQDIPIHGGSRTVSESSCGSPNNMSVFRGHATKLCETYLAGKNCRYGSRCWYAHGTWELKHFEQSSKNKHIQPLQLTNPTSAQMEWMLRSQQAEMCPERELVHESIILGNRFGSGKVYTQQGASTSPPIVPMKLPHNRPAVHTCPTPKHSFVLPPVQAHRSKPLLELLMDSDVPIHENEPDSSMPYTMPEVFDNFPHTAIQLPQGFLGFIKNYNAQKKSSDRCDIFAVSGFCPLGNECNFQHTCND